MAQRGGGTNDWERWDGNNLAPTVKRSVKSWLHASTDEAPRRRFTTLLNAQRCILSRRAFSQTLKGVHKTSQGFFLLPCSFPWTFSVVSRSVARRIFSQLQEWFWMFSNKRNINPTTCCSIFYLMKYSFCSSYEVKLLLWSPIRGSMTITTDHQSG